MAIGIVKVFPQDTNLNNMKTIDSSFGYTLSDIINTEQYPTYVEETLYTSLNQIRFYYPITGINYQYLKNGNHVLYPTPTGYNLYTIDNISITTDEEVLQVDAQHYSVNYMRDSAHELAVGRNAATITSINDTLTQSAYVSEDFKLVGEGTASGAYTLKDDSYNNSLASATVGSALVGANSLLRRYYGQYLRRNLDHLEAFQVHEYIGEVQPYPIVLGINVRDMDYSIDTSDIYTTAMLSSTTVPDLRIPGGDSIGGRYSGIGGSFWTSLSEIPDGLTMSAIYKGLPMEITKSGGNISVKLGKLVSNSGDTDLLDPIPEAMVVYSSNSLVISRGDIVYLNESINPDYLYAITVQNKTTNTDHTYQYLGKNKFIGEQGYTYTTKIPAHTFQYPLRATTTHKGNAVKYVDYEPFEVTGEPDETGGTADFYYWHLYKFTNYWTEFESQKLLEPTFEARFTIDDMRTLYGRDVINSHIFRVGDLYKVDAQDYGLQFNAAITKTKYNGITGELIEIEFGNRQDTQLEELKATNINKPTERKQNNTTSPSYTSRPTQSSGGGGGFNKDDADKWFEDAIKDGQLSDELGEWLDDALNGDDLRDDKDLFDGDLPYIKRTDDTGIPKMEWDPAYVTISTDGDETTKTKLVCYNGAEAVISEVKFKGQYDTVRLDGSGRFRAGETFLPNNVGFPIVPYPEGTYNTRTWEPVFNIVNGEVLNKDTEHNTHIFTEKNGTTAEGIALAKEELGYRYHLAVNATTKGTIKFETERVMLVRYLNELSKKIRGNPTYGMHPMYQIKDKSEFKREVLDRLQGQTVKGNGYDANLANDVQSLAYYLKQVDDGEQPYLKTIYRQLLKDILYHVADRVGYTTGEVISFGDILKVTVEFTVEGESTYRHKRIIGVEFNEDALERQTLRDGPFIKEEAGWNRLIFTQPTTKVNDQTVKVNQLLITNGGTSAKDALISKQSVDDLWKLLTPDERKEFDDIFGKEWLFNLRYTPNHYASDDILFGAFYRDKHKIKPPGIFDIFGTQAALVKKDQEIAKKIATRYQHKYNFLVANGYTVQPSHSGQVTYDRVEKHYLELGQNEA